jgi:hypothetical protein
MKEDKLLEYSVINSGTKQNLALVSFEKKPLMVAATLGLRINYDNK